MNLRVFYLTRRGLSDGYALTANKQRLRRSFSNGDALKICSFASFSVLLRAPQVKKYRQN